MPTDNEAWKAAADRGHVGVLKFAYDSKYILDVRHLCQGAALNGHINVFKWVYEVEGSRFFDAETCRLAAAGGFTEGIQWLRSVGCDWNEDACRIAVEKGRLDTLKWLISNGCPFDVNRWGSGKNLMLDTVSLQGNVEMMRFLINDCHANVNLTAYGMSPLFHALFGNQLEAVKLLLNSGADFATVVYGETALSFAQHCGQTEIAQVLRDAGASE